MNNTAWQQARKRAGLPQVRIHDLKHTFGRRLRAVGVSYEKAANRVCEADVRKVPTLVVLKLKAPAAVAASA